MKKDPFLAPDDAAISLAKSLVEDARHGALGVLQDTMPFVSRIALAPQFPNLVTLVSDLAPHTAALRQTEAASLLVGEPGKGDPLAHPRLSLFVRPRFLDKTDDHVAAYLAVQPKAQLYIHFGDFHLVELKTRSAILNGGFGKAYRLGREDFQV